MGQQRGAQRPRQRRAAAHHLGGGGAAANKGAAGGAAVAGAGQVRASDRSAAPRRPPAAHPRLQAPGSQIGGAGRGPKPPGGARFFVEAPLEPLGPSRAPRPFPASRPPFCRSHLVGPAARQAAAARRRRRAQLTRILLGALLVAFLTGTTSYRLHLAMKADQDPDEEPGALSGLRSWLSGGRRSLRQGPSGDELLAMYNGYRDPGAQGVQLHDEWWLIGVLMCAIAVVWQKLWQGHSNAVREDACAQAGHVCGHSPSHGARRCLQRSLHLAPACCAGGATPAALEQQQQDEAIDSSPIHRLVRARRLQPASLRVYDFEQRAWVQQHALTRVSRGREEVPWDCRVASSPAGTVGSVALHPCGVLQAQG